MDAKEYAEITDDLEYRKERFNSLVKEQKINTKRFFGILKKLSFEDQVFILK